MARQMKVLVAIILAVSLFLDFPAAVFGDDLERSKSNPRVPKPLPEEFIRQNGLDLDKVRRREDQLQRLYGYLNSLEDYRPLKQKLDDDEEVLPSQKP
ncbi:hypothetical protein CCACVL1_07591 [Corchorus capsularis]|uniref:Uncharacterized protein n=1 Tax=Corchorus capsularis TaxID=210143 RepID=A0A1R3J4T7_COCAP|nr:hypothetical protein CCACVL1_07591 [Corchorus capsularis]